MGCAESKSERARREQQEALRLERERKREAQQIAHKLEQQQLDDDYIAEHAKFCQEVYIPLIKQWKTLRGDETKSTETNTNIKSQKCAKNIIKTFQHEFDDDRNGIFWWLRRRCYDHRRSRKNNWEYFRNEVGIININHPPLQKLLANRNAFTPGIHGGSSGTTLYGYYDPIIYPDRKKPAVEITLFDNRYGLRPTCYSIRTYDNKTLCNWNFEGSNDGVTWDVIKSHINDKSLPINKNKIVTYPVDCKYFYNHFRIIMTGVNQINGWQLCYGGLEIYGDYATIYPYLYDRIHGNKSYQLQHLVSAYVTVFFYNVTAIYVSKDIVELIISMVPENIQYEAYWMGRWHGGYPWRELYEKKSAKRGDSSIWPISHRILPYGNLRFSAVNDLNGYKFRSIENEEKCVEKFWQNNDGRATIHSLKKNNKAGIKEFKMLWIGWCDGNLVKDGVIFRDRIKLMHPDCTAGVRWCLMCNGDIYKRKWEHGNTYHMLLHNADRSYMNFISDLKDYYEWNVEQCEIEILTDDELNDFSDFIISQIVEISSTFENVVFVLKCGYVFMIHGDNSMKIFGVRRMKSGCLSRLVNDDHIHYDRKLYMPRLLLNVRNVKKCKLISFEEKHGRKCREVYKGIKLFYLGFDNKVFVVGNANRMEVYHTPKLIQFDNYDYDYDYDDKTDPIIDIESNSKWYCGGIMILTKKGNIFYNIFSKRGESVNIDYRNNKFPCNVIVDMSLGEDYTILLTATNELIVHGKNDFNQCLIANAESGYVDTTYLTRMDLNNRLEFPDYCTIKKVLCTEQITFLVCPAVSAVHSELDIERIQNIFSFRSINLEEWSHRNLMAFVDSIGYYMDKDMIEKIRQKIIDNKLSGKDLIKFRGYEQWHFQYCIEQQELKSYFGIEIDNTVFWKALDAHVRKQIFKD
eukprot:188476_1